MAASNPASQQPARSWRSIALASLTLLGTFVSGGVLLPIGQKAVDHFYDEWKSAKDKEEAAIKDFVREAQAIDQLIAAYVAVVADTGQADARSRQKIVDNLNQQRYIIEKVFPYLKPEAKVRLRNYEATLDALNDVLPQSNTILTMRQFWERTSDLVVARTAVLQHLAG